MTVMKHLEEDGDAARAKTLEEFEKGVQELTAKVPQAKALYAGAIADEIMTNLDFNFRFKKLLGDGPLNYETGSTGNFTRIQIHPAVEAIAKAQERIRRAMKELLAQLEEEGEEAGLGLADLVQPIVEKAGDVLQDEIEYQSRAKESRAKETQQGRDRTHAGPPLEDRPCTDTSQEPQRSALGGA